MQLASCTAYLPPNGAVAYELNGGEPAWDMSMYIMADVANSLRCLVWQNTKDGQKNRNKPEVIKPWVKENEKPEAFDVETLDEILGRKRT